ncbi:MAG: hypothetical protein HON77_18370 [Gammaproteobacteria bacterium]|nr:hypothetical protein [Gammaproteobacteria bacterium]
MQKFLVFLFLTPIIVACSPPADDAPEAAQAEIAAVPEAAQAEMAAAPEAPEPAAYYEFLWCKFGGNYSTESRDAYFADFNTIVDSMMERGMRSFGYAPRDWESEDFDALWVNRWPDKETSLQGWAEWRLAGGNEKLQADHPDVLMCGEEPGTDAFGYTTYIPKDLPAAFSVENPPYHVDNLFCTFNEGKGPEDIRAYLRDHYMPFLDRYTADNPDNSYWFAIGVPDFEPMENYPQDFNWLNYFTNAEEAAAGIANYEKETDLQNQMAEVVTCSDRSLWNAMPIRVPPSAT